MLKHQDHGRHGIERVTLIAKQIRIRPKFSLSVTAVVSFLVIMVPVSAILYWYAFTGDSGLPWVVALDVIVSLACLAVLIRQMFVATTVADGILSGNGIFSGRVSVPISEIKRVELVRVYARNSPDTSIQFMALDASGACLYRLRGGYWHERDLTALAAALSVETHTHPTPLAGADFFEQYPRSRYWFERTR